jgi:maleylpyruvate isomerase
MELYDYFRSSASFRVRIGLNLKGLSPERRFIHLTRDGGEQFGADFTQLNPQQLVPVLVDKGESFTQSLAILEYLDETHPEPPFLPKDAIGRARVRSLALSIACDLHPLNNLRVLFYLRDQLDQPEEARNTWYRHWVAKGLEALEGALAGNARTGDFCHGDVPGLADICLVPQIFNAKRFDCPLEAYPVVMRVFETCMTHPAFKAAHPAAQPDAE